MKILHLTLKKKWFDMILSGEKKEEYREIKPYWIKRLNFDVWNPRPFDVIRFTNGYGKNAPTMDVELKSIQIGTNIPEWSDAAETECYVLNLGEIISTANLPK